MSIPRFEPADVRAVVFDIGGVFLYPAPEPVQQRLSDAGLTAPDRDDAYREAHHAGARALYDSGRSVAEHDNDFWDAYDSAYAQALGVPAAESLTFRVAIRTAWNWPHPENIAAFHRLTATGMPTAIVSNNDGTAPQQMIDHGVCQVGDGPLPRTAIVVDSSQLGVAKPDPAIMTPALDALGHEPGSVLYVGDTVHADVIGATNAGMQVVQLDPFDHHADLDHVRVKDVATLLTQLGVT